MPFCQHNLLKSRTPKSKCEIILDINENLVISWPSPNCPPSLVNPPFFLPSFNRRSLNYLIDSAKNRRVLYTSGGEKTPGYPIRQSFYFHLFRLGIVLFINSFAWSSGMMFLCTMIPTHLSIISCMVIFGSMNFPFCKQ